jgi:protein TonB
MFADSILETSWTERTHRSWTTLTSFGLQVVVISLLLLLPLLKTVGLPSARVLATPVSLSAPPPVGPIVRRQNTTTVMQSNIADDVLIAPPSIPRHIEIIDETTLPPQVSYNNVPGVEGGTGNGTGNGVWRFLGDTVHPAVPLPPPATNIRTFRTSKMLEGSLIRRVQPTYPPLARNARVEGSVVLAALISKAGTMENLRLISGHPMLAPAAIEAVSQWRYRPYILNSEPIEVETQITVNFVLGGN